MFSLVNGFYDNYLAPTQLNVLVIGTSQVGKTTLLERLKVTQLPKRPSSKSRHEHNVTTAAGAILPLPLTPELSQAFMEGGAVISTSHQISSFLEDDDDDDDDNDYDESSATSPSKSRRRDLSHPPPTPAVLVTQKRNFRASAGGKIKALLCPAPERYRNSAADQEEDFVLEDDVANQQQQQQQQQHVVKEGDSTTAASSTAKDDNQDDDDDDDDEIPLTPQAPRRVRCHSKEFSMNELDLINSSMREETSYSEHLEEDSNNNHNNHTSSHRTSSMQSIPLEDDDHAPPALPVLTNTKRTHSKGRSNNKRVSTPLHQSSSEEFDLKPNAKMLPLEKMRPTIGTNLGKVEMLGAKCHIFDVGGKMESVWDRYYEDCDAVIFCWRLGNDPDKPDGYNPDDDDEEPVDFSQQQETLNKVRASISDDVPFLVFGHVFVNINTAMVDKLYSTHLVLPHYHNPMTGLSCGSAKTGAGVQSAMEWLIPLAKRQQRERLAAKKQLEEK